MPQPPIQDLPRRPRGAPGKNRRLLQTTPLLVTLVLPAFIAPAVTAQEEASPQEQRRREVADALSSLAPRYREWVQSVAGLMTQAELDYFVALEQDYRRDQFMEKFWEPRDPDPATPQNELRRRWEEFLRTASAIPYGDPRFVLFLLNGPPGRFTLPDGRLVTRCYSRTQELEIWFYDGSERTSRELVVIFQKRSRNTAYEVYYPGASLRPVQRVGGLPTMDIRMLCADELLRYALYEISRLASYDDLLQEVMSPPLPSQEWLASLEAGTTDLPEGAETFDVRTEIHFPGRNQSRTAVQVVLAVPLDEAPGRRFDDRPFYNFLVTGEVIRDGSLFEDFRYRFEGPIAENVEQVPVGFTRYLRPGTVTLRVLMEDVFGGRFAQVVREIEVPSPEGMPSVREAQIEQRRPSGPSLELLPPPGNVLSGLVRFNTRAFGEIDKVTFYLDGNPVLSKRTPPYSVELNLGEVSEPHRVRVVGFAENGDEIATDQIWLNQGSQRFRVHLIEPRSGGIYPGSVTARVDVLTPGGEGPERVELFLDDEKIATLTEMPYTETLEIEGAEPTVVRAVAYLADGTTAEDAVVINAAPFSEEVEVRLVEAHALVRGPDGAILTGLEQSNFTLRENGVEQQIVRFEEAGDAPIHAALLVDRSASMKPHLDSVQRAASRFAAAVRERPEDRVALASFADTLSVEVGFDSPAAQLERSLASLVAGGRTALYDSVVQTLNNFAGIEGRVAVVLFTDGRDEISRSSYEQMLERARRAGVIVYAVTLAEAFADRDERRPLEELVSQTGGEAYFLDGLAVLEATYDRILSELRSRYLLAYEPPAAGERGEFRTIEVEVDVRGAEVRARSGYYP